MLNELWQSFFVIARSPDEIGTTKQFPGFGIRKILLLALQRLLRFALRGVGPYRPEARNDLMANAPVNAYKNASPLARGQVCLDTEVFSTTWMGSRVYDSSMTPL